MIFFWLLSFIFWGDDNFEYAGSHRCIACHKKEEQGNQAKAWAETAHANAMETLYSQQAAQWAKERGITKPPYEEPGCVKCHSVGFNFGGFELKDASFWNPKEGDKKAIKAVKRMEHLKNVGCEACHGPGGSYKTRKKMKAIFHGELDGESLGLETITEETCTKCHNAASPAFKEPFVFEEAMKKISHAYPPEFKEKKLKEK